MENSTKLRVSDRDAKRRLASLLKNNVSEIRLESEVRTLTIRNREMIVTWKDNGESYSLGHLTGLESPKTVADCLIKHEAEAVRLNLK